MYDKKGTKGMKGGGGSTKGSYETAVKGTSVKCAGSPRMASSTDKGMKKAK